MARNHGMSSENRKRLRRSLLNSQGEYCAICYVTYPAEFLTIDHIKPVSKGGSNRLWNLRLVCKACNHAKGDTYAPS